eukprot:scaffold123645_cov57-Phaeocystis_antarctica.AAC.1
MPSGSQGLCRPVQWRSLAASSAAGFRLGTRPRPSRFQLGGSDDHRPCSARCSGGCEPSYVRHATYFTHLPASRAPRARQQRHHPKLPSYHPLPASRAPRARQQRQRAAASTTQPLPSGSAPASVASRSAVPGQG